MLPSSVRRVVAATPQSPTVSSLSSSVPRAAASYSLSYRPTGFQQRRYSSSKPSSPDDGSKDFAARPVPASRSSKTEKSKGQAKAAAPQPPSVPSTRHIGDEGLALSTFFALHRPISVTQLMPKSVSDDAFARIFATRTRNNRVADVLSTLSQTVSDLEEPLSKLNVANGDKQRSQEAHDAEEGTAKLSLKHSDGSETNLHIQLNPMAGQYLPYAPPPAPEPLAETAIDAESANSAIAEELAEPQDAQTRVYKAMVTIEETVDADGQVKVVAHSPELVEEGATERPQSFLERMLWRQLRYDESRRHQGRTMQAISVRRQRKLRMKKKKYKKLMKKTRNLRRKLDRL
ncbi:hypothetical protein CHGG_01364 [Chaetomium globosum CBS 148.51]|uniref:Small ribosomal subunit protein mS38 n=1 Tax=Chaetomium globosum (strain ATCC 6205 / CBS 148.51 / DSM 1962 / NBRC 6347 / NRRL 1970) TaxID=306901 RepID=Q2HEJ0_CHAGB|nr:uncharacterized protein CHGG_01364 [Chaetomium globosum CBS 148.51]EAQ93129.1 hypothetical protein CHGG_01364 [Chaetomium globosum CBS 148.51]